MLLRVINIRQIVLCEGRLKVFPIGDCPLSQVPIGLALMPVPIKIMVQARPCQFATDAEAETVFRRVDS